jgi:ATP-dependent exoDNAse (exonuclease V) alpha subunit
VGAVHKVKRNKSEIDINPQFKHALDVLQDSHKHLFITGRAGTGKSTLLRYYLSNVESKNIVVLAPTGIAAINVSGETIHHFLKIRANATPDDVARKARSIRSKKDAQLYKKVTAIIIDEISMVRADLFDYLDSFLRIVRRSSEPFGGVRIICFGDLYQLAPVVTKDEKELFFRYYETPYFFSSSVFAELRNDGLKDFEYIELEKIYRQKDTELIDVLNAVRNSESSQNGTNLQRELTRINTRVLKLGESFPSHSIILTVTNKKADSRNQSKLDELDSPLYISQSDIIGDFPNHYKPTSDNLQLKVGARVMVLINGENYSNGSLGNIEEIDDSSEISTYHKIKVLLDSGESVSFMRHEWDVSYNEYNEESGLIESKSLGIFEQFPLRLAWAITIHKAQGQTFDELIIDFERSAFAKGQAYVALSRATGFSGLHLIRPIRQSDILLDKQMVRFLADIRAQIERNSSNQSIEDIESIFQRIINSEEAEVLDIVYLRSDGSIRETSITPLYIDDNMQMPGTTFRALIAYCHPLKAKRTFDLDRVISVTKRGDTPAQPIAPHS